MAGNGDRREAFRAPSSASAQLAERARRVMPGGNTRNTLYQSPHPPYAAHGAGAVIVDVDGDARLDFINNYTSLIHGHADADVNAAVIAQLEHGTAYAMPTAHEVALAELIVARIPSVEQVRFTNSGSESVMMAIKGARAYTGRPKILKFEGCYHGSYDFAEISMLTPASRWEEADTPSTASAFGTPQGVIDNVLVAKYNDVAEAERIITANHRDLAAVLMDPMPSRVGTLPATPEFLAALRGLTATYGIVLIFDEVITLRVGYGGMQAVVGVTPDMTTMAKIIGGGFPVGAVGGKAEIMAVFDPRASKVPHGGTFNANPITMVAGIAAMEKMTPEAFARLDTLGDRLREGLGEAMDGARVPGQVTGAGSLFNLHFHDRPLSDYRSAVMTTPEEKARAAAAYRGLLAHGVFLSPTLMGCLSTPMGEAEVDACVDAFAAALRE